MQSPRRLAPPPRSDTGQPIVNPGPARARWIIAFALVALMTLTFPQPAGAAPGDPDLTFHGRGWTLVPVGITSGSRFAVQEDGRMVAAGSIGSQGNRLVIHRFLADGSPDLSFNDTGNVTSDPVAGSFLGGASVIAPQPDGKLLAAGLAMSTPGLSGFQIVLLRYLPDGTLDPAFGEGSGVVTTPVTTGHPPGSLAVQSNGGILLSMFLTVWRFEPSGTRDLSFAQPASGGTVKVLSDSKILVCQGGGNPLAVQRLLPGGNLDSTFGVNGTALVTVPAALAPEPPGYIEQEPQVEVLPDGRICIGGQLRRGGIPSQPPIVTDLLVMRLLPNGSPDTAFNGSGVAVFDNGSSSKFCGAQVFQTGAVRKWIMPTPTRPSSLRTHPQSIVTICLKGI